MRKPCGGVPRGPAPGSGGRRAASRPSGVPAFVRNPRKALEASGEESGDTRQRPDARAGGGHTQIRGATVANPCDGDPGGLCFPS